MLVRRVVRKVLSTCINYEFHLSRIGGIIVGIYFENRPGHNCEIMVYYYLSNSKQGNYEVQGNDGYLYLFIDEQTPYIWILNSFLSLILMLVRDFCQNKA